MTYPSLGWDNPEYDGTDGAHPAWWRGEGDGVVGAVKRIREVLAGDIRGVTQEPLQGLREDIYKLVESRKDLEHKLQYLLDWVDQCHQLNPEDGAFTFPDGETWFANRPPKSFSPNPPPQREELMLYRQILCPSCKGNGKGMGDYGLCLTCSGRRVRYEAACDGTHHEWIAPIETDIDHSGSWCGVDACSCVEEAYEKHRECRNCGIIFPNLV